MSVPADSTLYCFHPFCPGALRYILYPLAPFTLFQDTFTPEYAFFTLYFGWVSRTSAFVAAGCPSAVPFTPLTAYLYLIPAAAVLSVYVLTPEPFISAIHLYALVAVFLYILYPLALSAEVHDSLSPSFAFPRLSTAQVPTFVSGCFPPNVLAK